MVATQACMFCYQLQHCICMRGSKPGTFHVSNPGLLSQGAGTISVTMVPVMGVLAAVSVPLLVLWWQVRVLVCDLHYLRVSKRGVCLVGPFGCVLHAALLTVCRQTI